MADNQMPQFVNPADILIGFTGLGDALDGPLPSPCPHGLCDGTGCEGGCYITSPDIGRPYSSFSEGPLANSAGSYIGLPISTMEMSIPAIVRPSSQPKRPSVETNLSEPSRYPASILGHLQDQYVPGFMPPSAPASYIGSFSTPNTAVPSLAADDGFSLPSPIEVRVRDFTGRGRGAITFECERDSFMATQELTSLVNDQRYMVQNHNDINSGNAIEALQKSMSFTLRGKVPPTVGHLQVMLYYATGLQYSGNPTQITPSHLSMVLEQYERQSGMEFQLGIVSPGSSDGSYRVSVHRFIPYAVPTLWLYHSPPDFGSNERWSAIIPHVMQNGPSYAAAVRAKPPSADASKPVPNSSIDPTLLHPSAALLAVNRQLIHPNNSSRASPGRGARSAGQSNAIRRGRPHGHGRRSSQASRAPSVNRISDGDRPHKCDHCEASFLYPKDLKRHTPKHTKSKAYPCPYCVKSFTRDDNMKRHLASAHPEPAMAPGSFRR